eukprot:gene3172-3450_t
MLALCMTCSPISSIADVRMLLQLHILGNLSAASEDGYHPLALNGLLQLPVLERMFQGCSQLSAIPEIRGFHVAEACVLVHLNKSVYRNQEYMGTVVDAMQPCTQKPLKWKHIGQELRDRSKAINAPERFVHIVNLQRVAKAAAGNAAAAIAAAGKALCMDAALSPLLEASLLGDEGGGRACDAVADGPSPLTQQADDQEASLDDSAEETQLQPAPAAAAPAQGNPKWRPEEIEPISGWLGLTRGSYRVVLKDVNNASQVAVLGVKGATCTDVSRRSWLFQVMLYRSTSTQQINRLPLIGMLTACF